MFGKFKRFELTDKEVKVYLCLLMLGKKVDVRQIQSTTLISRTSIYSVLKGLIRKGMASNAKHEEGDRLVEHFVANDPGVLLDSLERKRALIQEKEKLAKELICEVKAHFCTQDSSDMQVEKDLSTFFSGLAATGEDRPLLIYQSSAFDKRYANVFRQHVLKLSSPVKILVDEEFDASQLAQCAHVNIGYLGSKFAPAATLLCYDKAALWVVSSVDETEADRAFLIQDMDMVQDCVALLFDLWDTAQGMQTVASKRSSNEIAEEEMA